jgi:hypothetical protein
LGIRGNQNLTHKEDRQIDRKKIVLYFPATSLDGFKGRFFPPDNEFIRTIITNEQVENETTNSTIYITLKSEPVATALRTVTTETLEDTATVNVKANGAIKNYKAFTLVNPDRIVFDIYKIKSPHQNEQKIAVQSKWIKQIRYYGHPNKLRLVIEALNISDSKYSSVSTDSGLLISVGGK